MRHQKQNFQDEETPIVSKRQKKNTRSRGRSEACDDPIINKRRYIDPAVSPGSPWEPWRRGVSSRRARGEGQIRVPPADTMCESHAGGRGGKVPMRAGPCSFGVTEAPGSRGGSLAREGIRWAGSEDREEKNSKKLTSRVDGVAREIMTSIRHGDHATELVSNRKP